MLIPFTIVIRTVPSPYLFFFREKKKKTAAAAATGDCSGGGGGEKSSFRQSDFSSARGRQHYHLIRKKYYYWKLFLSIEITLDTVPQKKEEKAVQKSEYRSSLTPEHGLQWQQSSPGSCFALSLYPQDPFTELFRE